MRLRLWRVADGQLLLRVLHSQSLTSSSSSACAFCVSTASHAIQHNEHSLRQDLAKQQLFQRVPLAIDVDVSRLLSTASKDPPDLDFPKATTDEADEAAAPAVVKVKYNRDTDAFSFKRIVRFKRLKLKQGKPSRVSLIDEHDALREYLLKTEHLAGLPSRNRRSSYFGERPVRVFFEEDVYQKAIQVHGSAAALERLRRLAHLQHDVNDIRSPFHRKFHSSERADTAEESKGLDSRSGKVVRWAVLMNGLDSMGKYLGWWLTGSSSMFAEAMHSTADTLNQIILAFGIHTGSYKPSSQYPYGFGQMRYITSLISGVGIFFIGGGFSVYHGVEALLYPPDHVQPMNYAFYILGMSFLFQSSSAYRAFHELRQRSLAENISIVEYMRLQRDPSVNVVLLEDGAAVAGVLVALSAISLSAVTGSPVPDSIGSIVIGVLMGGVASKVIRTNTSALVGQALPVAEADALVKMLESDTVITSVHDVKIMSIGPGQVRLKAEVDFDGAMVTEAYLKKRNMHDLMQSLQHVESEAELKECFLDLGEGIIDQLGEEIDRVEGKIKKRNPRIRHIDLEAL